MVNHLFKLYLHKTLSHHTQSQVMVARFSEPSFSLTCHILLTNPFTTEVNSSPEVR